LLREYVEVLGRPSPPLGGLANYISLAHPPDNTWKQGLLQIKLEATRKEILGRYDETRGDLPPA
jgi:hypothetical protein